MRDNNKKLADCIQAVIDTYRFTTHTVVSLDILKQWQQQVEQLETNPSQQQGEEYDLSEPLFTVQLTLTELDDLVDFVGLASKLPAMQHTVSAATWRLLERKISLLNVQVKNFNKQRIMALSDIGERNANT